MGSSHSWEVPQPTRVLTVATSLACPDEEQRRDTRKVRLARQTLWSLLLSYPLMLSRACGENYVATNCILLTLSFRS